MALIFALNTGRDLAFDLLYFVTGVILLALWWAWANLRGLQLRRVTRPQRSQVGRYFEESLELTNQLALAQAVGGSARSLRPAGPSDQPGRQFAWTARDLTLAGPHAVPTTRPLHRSAR